mgnify:CR=1 FL=1
MCFWWSSLAANHSHQQHVDLKPALLKNLQCALQFPSDIDMPEETLLFNALCVSDAITGEFSRRFNLSDGKSLRVVMFEWFYTEPSPLCLRYALMDFHKCDNEEEALEKAIYFIADYGRIITLLNTLKRLTFNAPNPLLTAINWTRSSDGQVFSLFNEHFKFQSYLTVEDIKTFSGLDDEPWCYYKTIESLFEDAEDLEEALEMTIKLVKAFRFKIYKF